LIRDGVTYKKIQEITGLSSRTIATISQKMANKEGGLQKILKKMNPKGPSYWE